MAQYNFQKTETYKLRQTRILIGTAKTRSTDEEHAPKFKSLLSALVKRLHHNKDLVVPTVAYIIIHAPSLHVHR